MSEDVIRKQVSWTPLPCPWYLPSIRNYKFTFCHSILGYEIKTSGDFLPGTGKSQDISGKHTNPLACLFQRSGGFRGLIG